MRKSAGFTLIEIVIILVIIGALATIAIPSYMRSLERGRCTFAINTLKAMRSAALVYFRENQAYTGMTLDNMETLVGANFYSDNSHPDWEFTIFLLLANDFTLRAKRLNGPLAEDVINFKSNEQFTGSTYPYQDPGDF
ncbi:MAG: prepilin-type N-terminal cleavage/methylation domain-containing protein [Candidatus Omnitrophica bacterium]|nr:prepilin-type N-terminal cleavage/methylation domain-containing protein [Candidatus Omnitrophota bacterium]